MKREVKSVQPINVKQVQACVVEASGVSTQCCNIFLKVWELGRMFKTPHKKGQREKLKIDFHEIVVRKPENQFHITQKERPIV